MKTEYKVIATIFAFLIAFGVGAFIGVKLQPQPEKPTYDTTDSIAKDSLTKQIDTIKVKETVWRTRIKTIKETDTVYYEGTDSACIEIIQRKNDIILGQDSLIYLLDKEARTYSDLNVLEIRRNKTLSDSVSSLHVLYSDSLTAQRKQSDKAIKKEKGKTIFYKITTTIAATIGIYGIIAK